MKQRWTDKKVVERIKESIKYHWWHVEMNIEDDIGWKGTWIDFQRNWKEYDTLILQYSYHMIQCQNILDIKDEEMEEIIKEEQ